MWSDGSVLEQAVCHDGSDLHTGVSQISRVSSGNWKSSMHTRRSVWVPVSLPTMVTRSGW